MGFRILRPLFPLGDVYLSAGAAALALDPAEIDRLITELHMPPVVLEDPAPDGSYVVGHPATATVFTRDNLAHRIYPTGVTAGGGTRMEVWVNDLPRLDQGTFK